MSNAAALAKIKEAEKELTQLDAMYAELVIDTGLTAASMAPPPAGTAADVVSIGRSLWKGDWGGALLDAVGIIPIVGDGIKGASKGTKIASKMKDVKIALNAARAKLARRKLALTTDPKKLKADTDKALKNCSVQKCPKGRGGTEDVGKNVPYDSRTMREQLEAKYGKENVTSTTVPPPNSPNVKLAGKHKDIILKDGTKTQSVFDKKGFPIFDDVAKYDTRLPNEAFHAASYKGQMKMASRELSDQIKNGKINSSKFSKAQLKAIHSGKDKIPDYTWHHHQDNGRIQLIPTKIHGKVGHVGGEAMSKGQ